MFKISRLIERISQYTRADVVFGVVFEVADLDGSVDWIEPYVFGSLLLVRSNVGHHLHGSVAERTLSAELRTQFRVRVLSHTSLHLRSTFNHSSAWSLYNTTMSCCCQLELKGREQGQTGLQIDVWALDRVHNSRRPCGVVSLSAW